MYCFGFIFVFTLFVVSQARPVQLTARTSYSGQATYYEVGLGSCGKTNTDTQLVAALSQSLMKGANSSLCGKSINIKGKSGSVTVTVVDTCPSCSASDIDLSPAAFKKLGSLDTGVLPITWSL